MASFLGLNPNTNYGPTFLIANFVFAHFILVPRTFKQYYGIDNNASPRTDLTSPTTLSALKSGTLTQRQLDLIHRASAAHSNRVENYPVFAAATVLAIAVGVPKEIVNSQGLLYSVASVAYGAAYVLIERNPWSLVRTACWYAGCWACGRLLWEAGKVLNQT